VVPPGVGRVSAVLVDLDDALVPWHTLAHWQWAWRPRGPLLSERHALAAIHRSLHAWDRRRWQGLIGEAPPADLSSHADHLARTLAAIAGHSLPSAETSAVVQRFLRPAGEIETFPDAAPFLDRMARDGIAVGVTTVLPMDAAQHVLRRAGLGSVRLVATGDGPAPGLPALAALRAAVQGLGHRPRETVFIGDLFWSDVRAAARAGLVAVLIDRHGWSPRVQARHIASLAEVPGLLAAPPPAEEPTAVGPTVLPAPAPNGDAAPPVERKL
jgi:FMN phosphatase YigB (HAD superfamily)